MRIHRFGGESYGYVAKCFFSLILKVLICCIFYRQTIPVVGSMVAERLLPPVLLDAFRMYVLFVSSVVAVDVRGELEIKFKIDVIV